MALSRLYSREPKLIKAEMKARTPSQAGNLLSALRGMIGWMIDEGHLDEDDNPTIGLKSGKAKASRETGADCTESQMMAMFGWTDPKMPAHYIAQANREKLGMSGMEKIIAFDQSNSLDDFMPVSDANDAGTSVANKVVTLRRNFGKKTL